MPSGNFNATLTPTPPITIGQFHYPAPPTPGNVGVCLSGGGSRALTAGMGQLQALSYLNLLGSVKALSTVSGGSWLGVPFTFLPVTFLPANSAGDSTFLGVYNPNPGSLTLADLATLASGNAAAPLATDFFSPEFLALEAYILWEACHVPANMLWQTIIALNILSPCGLYDAGTDLAPADMFTADQSTLTAITNVNPSLKSETAYLVASQASPSRIPRPFLICNLAMLMQESSGDVQLLAPVQSTAYFTGILGAPTGTDANGLAPGGGGVTSFCFDSNFVSASGQSVVASQTRQWSLTDAAGTSSAFFAEEIANQFAYWENDFWAFLEQIGEFFEKIWKWIESHLPLEAQAPAKALLTSLAAKRLEASPEAIEFPVLDEMIPLYGYWPMDQTQPIANPKPSQFTDGGSLENSGLCGMLAYTDIDSVISCINSEQSLAAGEYGVSDGKGGFLDGTYIVVDDAIPPLFGYQPYDASGTGYVLYSDTTDPEWPQYAHNQIFDSAAFPAVLEGLWANSGASANAPAQHPAVFSQGNLTVLRNKWFGIQGGQSVTVVWCYLNYAQDWANLFVQNQPVAQLIASEIQGSNFPNYQTVDTDLSAQQINLMAALAAWSVVSTEEASKTFSTLFQAASQTAHSAS